MSKIKKCQICKSSLVQVFDLGKQPLCDDLIKIGSLKKNKLFDTKIVFCKNCIVAFNQTLIDPKFLFPKNYHYRSNLTKDVLTGMEDLVRQTKKNYGSLKNKVIVDIGSNDGSLLDIFKKHGSICVGVEPTNAAKRSIKKHFIYNDYFSEKISKKIKSKFKKIDYITFTNVFAHINDLEELLKNLKILITDETKIIIENHYLGSVVDRNQFDTFYHEHPRTYSLLSFIKIAKILGINLEHYSFPKRYGGNIRVVFGNEKKKIFYNKVISSEKKIYQKLLKFQNYINKWKVKTLKKIDYYNSQKLIVIGKAFPGRASILINILKLNKNHVRAIYEKPNSPKIGHFAPNTNIPIYSDKKLSKINKNSIIINFGWHISSEVKKYLIKLRIKNKVIDILK